MSLRVPDSALRDMALGAMTGNQARLAQLNAQVASGKRVQSPADDAPAYARAKQLRTVLTATNQYQQNISHAEDQLTTAEAAFNNLQGLLDRAKELALAMSNGTLDAGQRGTAAVEVAQLQEELTVLANTQLGGRYLFSGNITGTAPFDSAGNYSGDSGVRTIEVGEGVSLQFNVPGDVIFKGAGGGENLYQLLTDLNTALTTNDQAGVSATISRFDDSLDQVVSSRMINGFRLHFLDTQRNNLEDISFQSQKLLSEAEDLDLGTAVSELVMRQNSLEVTRNVMGRILGMPSLLDYIR